MSQPNYQKLLGQFNTDTSFQKLVKKTNINPDEFLYEILTDKGIFYIYETDYLESLMAIRKTLSNIFDSSFQFIPTKKQINWEKSGPVTSATTYKEPEDKSELIKYLNDKFNSQPHYFSLLVQKLSSF